MVGTTTTTPTSTALTSTKKQTTTMSPPVAKKVSHEMTMFGDKRVDNYYWLRDDSRSDPDILAHLQAENDYTDFIMSDTKKFEEELFLEMKGRIQEEDVSVPWRKGQFYYYKRMSEGKDYVQHCRRRVVDESAPISVHDTMPTDSDAPCPEHVILDENIKAQGHSYYKIGAFKVSPDNKLVAYGEDTKGGETYTVHIIDASTLAPVENSPLTGLTTDIEWADNGTLMYLTMDDTFRYEKAWLHTINTPQSDDKCLYHEKDDKFSLDLYSSESKKYLFLASGSKTTKFIQYMDISSSSSSYEFKKLTSCEPGVAATSVSHRGDHFIIQRRTNECFNSELVACHVNGTEKDTVVVLIPHRENVKLRSTVVFRDYVVTHVREDGLPKLVVYRLPPIGEPITLLQGGKSIEFVDPVYDAYPVPESAGFESNILRYGYSSLRTPTSVYDYDMASGVTVLKKIETVLGGDFDSNNYTLERKFATADDGTQIPISIIYHKNLAKLDGSDPLFIYGYGSYEMCVDVTFQNGKRMSLIDRGFVFVIAHPRGGGEMGRKWYEDGKFLKKMNTFTDFIACVEYLIMNKYGCKEKVCVNGRSAGGLLMGAVLNMRPDLFKVVVAGVPFVDVLTTMLDPSIPLTTSEYEEWGDPRNEEFYHYMKSYSPVDNVKAQKYPNILITTGINDPRVLYSEPAKFVAKLRELKTDDNLLLFRCLLGAGHFSKSGRFARLEEEAFTYTFVLKVLGMIPSSGSGQ